MKKILAFIFILIMVMPTVASGYEDTPVGVVIDGVPTRLNPTPVIRDGVTYVSVRALAKEFGFSYKDYVQPKSAIIESDRISVCISPENNQMTVVDLTGTSIYEYVFHSLSSPCVYMDGSLSIPVRDFAKVFNCTVNFDKTNNKVLLTSVIHTEDNIEITVSDNNTSEIIQPDEEVVLDMSAFLPENHVYYFQNEEEFNLPNFGSGYCWVCSYAMLISNVKGIKVTPNEVEAVNLKRTQNGAYCYHYDIVTEFNVYLTSALPEKSIFYGGRDMISGGTFINNPNKSDDVTRAALQEALRLHPEGVMVRYADFPHTMVAVGYENGKILFYDPAPTSSGSYDTTGRYKGVEFEKTCVYTKGYSISDITFMQALK